MKKLHANGGEKASPRQATLSLHIIVRLLRSHSPKPQADLPASVSPWGSRMRHEQSFVEWIGDRR